MNLPDHPTYLLRMLQGRLKRRRYLWWRRCEYHRQRIDLYGQRGHRRL
jgi:hypothetical protein